jgi:hypothetical protein
VETLREVEVPVPDELPAELGDAAVPVRASRVMRRKVRLHADWLTATVPIDHEHDVDVTDKPGPDLDGQCRGGRSPRAHC